MARIQRAELLDYLTYVDRRGPIRAAAMAAKDLRRVHLGEHLTFLFENVETLRYQVQEMMRVERMVRESDIQHELDTYNDILGGPGELGCTLLIEIPDEQERSRLLQRWRDLPNHIHMVCTDGTRVQARFDLGQMSEDKLSSVQFVKFPVGAKVPETLLCDLPELQGEVRFTDQVRTALLADLVE